VRAALSGVHFRMLCLHAPPQQAPCFDPAAFLRCRGPAEPGFSYCSQLHQKSRIAAGERIAPTAGQPAQRRHQQQPRCSPVSGMLPSVPKGLHFLKTA
jgi:hypothetical protein